MQGNETRVALRRSAGSVLIPFMVVLLAALGGTGGATTLAQEQAPEKPNIVFIVADDMRVDDIEYMPQTRQLLSTEGLTFENAFVSHSVCCPSRASILRGQYAHNHGVLNNDDGNAFRKFRNLGNEESTVATWLKSGGYRTVLLGKYLNGYGPKTGSETYVPPGWDDWYAKLDKGYYDYQLNENGRVVSYGSSEREYYTDVLADKARKYVRGAANDSEPFFMYLAPATPHGPFLPARRHRGEYSNVDAPRPPSFDEADVSDKPKRVRSLPRLGSADEKEIDETYRKRLEMLLSVDDMIAGLIKDLQDTGELENTYIFFTSDNGFHLGEHRLSLTKKTPYEEASRVPLVVRGPGVPARGSVEQTTLNSDFAPTMAELAGVSTPKFVDSRSLASLLDGTPPASWRSAFLLEAWGGPNPSLIYLGVRTGTHKYIERIEGETELYDLSSDPHELESQHEIANPALVESIKSRLEALKDCAGESCRDAEDAP
jgi:N-acetylglucosamine-6-sulfatase